MSWRSLVVGVPPLVLAAAGLVHPMELTPESSRRWTTLHVVLVVHTSAAGAAEQRALLRPVLDLGNTLGWIGSSAFLLGALATIVIAVRRCGGRALPGSAVLAVGSISFIDSHTYWPRGVLTKVVMSVGLVLLDRALAAAAPRSHPRAR